MNQLKTMRKKFQNPISLKLFLLGSFLIVMLFLTLKSKSNLPAFTSQDQSKFINLTTTINQEQEQQQQQQKQCNDKIPGTLSDAIIHYATMNSTPQQTIEEISVTARVLAEKSPCKFLVFGLGKDSLMWASLNYGGKTVFLEEDRSWIESIRKEIRGLESYHIVYKTKVSQAEKLLELRQQPECTTVVGDVRDSQCPLALKQLPSIVYEIEWDLIMVDATTGYHPGAPGRMGAIYTAGMIARRRSAGETHLFVHDVNRFVEDKYSKAFWCEGYMKEEVGLLRHFVVPSQRSNVNESMRISFCPE